MIQEFKNWIDPPFRDCRIAFVHVPKCGGQSLKRALVQLYRPWRTPTRRVVGLLDEMAARKAAETVGVPGPDLRKAIFAYHLAHPDAQLALGHYFFSRSVFEANRDRWQFVTLLRHPVDRWLSHYYYNASRAPDDEFLITDSIEDFIKSGRGRELGAMVVSIFTEDHACAHVTRDQSIQTAIDRLREFSLVGRTEEMPAFARRFKDRFGAELDIPKINVGKRPTAAQILTRKPEISKRLEEICRPDMAVYEAIFGEN